MEIIKYQIINKKTNVKIGKSLVIIIINFNNNKN
jgi:hypothetical protein